MKTFRFKETVYWRWKNNVEDWKTGTFVDFTPDGESIILAYPDRDCKFPFKLSEVEVKDYNEGA